MMIMARWPELWLMANLQHMQQSASHTVTALLGSAAPVTAPTCGHAGEIHMMGNICAPCYPAMAREALRH